MSSHRAIELGVLKTLRDHFGDAAGERVGLAHPNLQPPAVAGQWFVSVGQATCQDGPAISGDTQDDVYTLQIAVTFKTAYAPYDRLGWEVNEPVTMPPIGNTGAVVPAATTLSIQDVANAVRAKLREQYAVVNNANSFISGFPADADGFVEPFHRVTVGPVTDKPPSWVFSEVKGRVGELSHCLITATGARRIRKAGVVA